MDTKQLSVEERLALAEVRIELLERMIGHLLCTVRDVVNAINPKKEQTA